VTMSSRTEPAPARGAVMSMTASPSTTPTRRPPPGTWNWQSFIPRLSFDARVAARGTDCRGAAGAHETGPPPGNLVARLLVQDLPLRAALRDGTGVAPEDLADLYVNRLLDTRLVRERAKNLVPDVVRGLESDHAFLGQHLFGETRRQVEQSLAAPPHHS